ncbi:hypothetical protein QJS04_geneDACA014427 [Acorus gramineus]|uniref:Uncharacterized protein n=1 Tax=Acorus gramineus TaxID=55184 RepID=A0AAV9BMQ6_ACOGR|nr:hypothetical protein QJS04_geneDACA014427 [Acorus gramineus]
MPVPWKTAKISAVTRFVSGLRSRRRGSSLVVETGFPTSLADLVVKNRDRLKKSAKRRASPSPPAADPHGGVSDDPPPAVTAAQVEEESDPPNPPVIEIEEERLDPTVVVAEERERRFGWAPKVMLLVAMAIGTKKLTLGITVSAFVLLFFELWGIRLCQALKPPVNAKKRFYDRTVVDEAQVSIGYVQIAESDSNSMNNKKRLDFAVCDQVRGGGEKEEAFIGIQKNKDFRAGTAKFNAKSLKKFVCKRFQLKKKNSCCEDSMNFEVEEEGDDLILEESNEEEEEEIVAICEESNVLHNIGMIEDNVVGNNESLYKKVKAVHLIFLVVVLFGLVGGRIIALALTLMLYVSIKFTEVFRSHLKLKGDGSIVLDY